MSTKKDKKPASKVKASKCKPGVPQVGTEGTLSSSNFGAKTAQDAIAALEKRATAEARYTDATRELAEHNADDFIAYCKLRGVNSVDVVKEVADTHGIDLAADNQILSREKINLKVMLITVLWKAAKEAAVFIASDLAEQSEWLNIIQEYINSKVGNVFKLKKDSRVNIRFVKKDA